MTKRFNIVDGLIVIVISIITLSCLIPIVNTIMISLSDKASVAMGKVTFWPVNFNTNSYRELLKDTRFFTSFGVSVRRVLLAAGISTTLSVVMAYPLSKDVRVFPARNIYVWAMVITMLFNGGLIPTFLLIRNLGIMDTIWALVLPGAVDVFNTIILINFYKGIPRSLEEAALMDGAHPFYILFLIYVPLSKAAIATITLFTAVYHWNAFFDGRIYINTLSKQPLQTYIQSLSAQLNLSTLQNMSTEQLLKRIEVSDITFNAAKAIVSMIPIIAIYPFLQRYFITGIVLGAVKE